MLEASSWPEQQQSGECLNSVADATPAQREVGRFRTLNPWVEITEGELLNWVRSAGSDCDPKALDGAQHLRLWDACYAG
jgi:hypothetical protein